MKIINHTHWQTKDLKAIIQRCAAMEFDDGARRKKLQVTVQHTRRGGCSGYAWYHGNEAIVRIANPKGTWAGRRGGPLESASAHLKREFALVVCHEFAHCRGMRHRAMNSYYNGDGSHERYAWAADFPLRVKPGRSKQTSAEKTDRAHRHAVKMFALAQTRRKRAATIETKWRQKVRYYERRKAALGAAATISESGTSKQVETVPDVAELE